MKRLCVYFFYDRDGIVDNYVIYKLKDLVKNLDRLIFVSNGRLSEESKRRVVEVTEEIIERENKGFDVWGYKAGIEYVGYDNLGNYDELILMNFTIYGPLYPFSEMFREMDKRDIDFWGITKHHGIPHNPFDTKLDHIPEHIQSYFISIRKPMLVSDEFKNYWQAMPMINSYWESIGKHESIFTYTFEKYGYKSDVYVNTEDLKEYTNYPLMIKPLELVKKRKCLVFKRKTFSNIYSEFLDTTLGEPAVELYEYISKNFDYNLDMVWENLLRLENMADLKDRLHFNKVLPRDYVIGESSYKVALICHIYYKDLIEDTFEYILNMPENCDIYITTDTKDKVEAIQELMNKRGIKANIIEIENRGRDVSALLVGCKEYINNYDLVCFAHDKKTTQVRPLTIGESFSYKCFENILGSKEYVKNIIRTFEEDKYLGILMPPPPNHGNFFRLMGLEWGLNYNISKKIMKEIGLNVNIDIAKEPISPLGTMFWFRPKALKPLIDKNWQYKDFPKEPIKNDGTILHALERLYGISSQFMGYYNAWCMHDKFAAIELTNYRFMLRRPTSKGLRLKRFLKKILPPFVWNILKMVYLKFKKIYKKMI